MSNNDFYDIWRIKNEELRVKYNLPNGLGQRWECLPTCNSGCYNGCDRRCYSCFIYNDIQALMKIQK